MKTRARVGDASQRMEIDPFADEGETAFRSFITVYQYLNIGDFTWSVADINWAAIGDTLPEGAKKFAEALVFAADLAAKWSLERGGKKQRKKRDTE
jgi:hypothetical protein